MINTLLFDFGDVFINLDKTAPEKALLKYGDAASIKKMTPIAEKFEVGAITTQDFLDAIKAILPNASLSEILDAWNSMLLDFPEHRLEFIKQLADKKEYELILLSNTNEAHIAWIQENIRFYANFKSCFDTFYLSHEIQLRKPNRNIFEYVISQHQLKPSEILFIDDTKANTDTAKQLGIQTWTINPTTEDVVDLFSSKTELF